MKNLEEILVEHKQSLGHFESGRVKLFETDSSGRIVDGSVAYIEKLRRWIAEIESLLAERVRG